MATVKECQKALTDLARRLGEVDPETRSRHVQARALSCELTDLDVTFLGLLDEDGLHDITTGTPKNSQVRLKMSSDDLIALCNGDLNLAKAWAVGRVRVDASLTDILKLRTLL